MLNSSRDAGERIRHVKAPYSGRDREYRDRDYE